MCVLGGKGRLCFGVSSNSLQISNYRIIIDVIKVKVCWSDIRFLTFLYALVGIFS